MNRKLPACCQADSNCADRIRAGKLPPCKENKMTIPNHKEINSYADILHQLKERLTELERKLDDREVDLIQARQEARKEVMKEITEYCEREIKHHEYMLTVIKDTDFESREIERVGITTLSRVITQLDN